jgi:hypothetical protein
MDRMTSKSYHSNRRMRWECFSLHSILGLAMRVRLKTTYISSEHYSTGIFWNVSMSSLHIVRFTHTTILIRGALLTLMVVTIVAWWIQAICGGIHKIKVLPDWEFWQLDVYPTRLSWPIFWVISMSGHCIPYLVIFRNISTRYRNSLSGFLMGRSHIPQKVSTTLTKHGTIQLKLCYHNLDMLLSLAMAWNKIVLMNCSDNVTSFWLPGLGIIRNKFWLLQSYMAHAQCAIFITVCQWGIPLFNQATIQLTGICTRSW